VIVTLPVFLIGIYSVFWALLSERMSLFMEIFLRRSLYTCHQSTDYCRYEEWKLLRFEFRKWNTSRHEKGSMTTLLFAGKPFEVVLAARYFFAGSECKQVAVGMVGAHAVRATTEPLVPDGFLFTVLAFFTLHVRLSSNLHKYPVLPATG
jgi:hypothetical protein